MTVKKRMLVVLSALALIAGAEEAQPPIVESPLLPRETKTEKDARMKWWADARFGMFIHFGLYSVLARHEWIQNHERIPSEIYQKNMKYFNPDLFDARQWVRDAKRAGMKYIVLTTKHHEGFCMWDTKTTDFKITHTDFKRDLVREYVEACRAEGIRVGFYYSVIDWHHPHFKIDTTYPVRPRLPTLEENKKALAELNKQQGRDMEKYVSYLKEHVTELLTEYGKIDIIFFDYTYPDFHGINSPDDYHSEEILALTRKLQPGIIVNDRLGLKHVRGGWDIKTPEQAYVPKCPTFNGEEVYWEVCQTFSGSWGYYRDEYTWKNTRQLLDILIDAVSKKGNLLLNVGPTARGEFDDRARVRLAAMGDWMHYNARAIYGCTAAPETFAPPEGTKLTYNPETDRLYVHLLEYPVKVLPFAFDDRVEHAQFLHDGSEIKVKPSSHDKKNVVEDFYVPATFILPVEKPRVEIPVIEIFLKRG